MRTLLATALCVALAGCAGNPRQGELRQYICGDGTAFSLEVADHWVRLRTVTGPIELRRSRHEEYDDYFTNGLRSVVLYPNGAARQQVGQREWTDCEWSG